MYVCIYVCRYVRIAIYLMIHFQKMNSWFRVVHIVAVSYRASTFATPLTAGECSSASFNRHVGYVLRGNVITEYPVMNNIQCRKKCRNAANCMSVNVIKNADCSSLCQLNKAKKESSPSGQFVARGGSEYFGLKVSHFDRKVCCVILV